MAKKKEDPRSILRDIIDKRIKEKKKLEKKVLKAKKLRPRKKATKLRRAVKETKLREKEFGTKETPESLKTSNETTKGVKEALDTSSNEKGIKADKTIQGTAISDVVEPVITDLEEKPTSLVRPSKKIEIKGDKRAEFGIKDTIEHILKATAPGKKAGRKAGVKDAIEHVMKARENKPQSFREFGIKDTIKHILKTTAPDKKLKQKGRQKDIKDETKNIPAPPAGHKGIKEALEHILHGHIEKKVGITPEQLLKLKKAREEFMKQGTYKEMEKKVGEEVEEIKEIKEAVKAKAADTEKNVKVSKKLAEKKETKAVESKKPEFIKTGVEGLDILFEEGRGVPKGTSVLIVGGPGTGKTLFCLHMVNYAASKGEKCLYLSFEESTERLKQHMRDFGWNPDALEKKGLLVIKRIDPYEISRSIEALLAQSRGELLIEVEGISSFIPKDFKPDRIIVDSVTALTAAFASSDSGYRSYIEQSFLFMEKLGATSFLVSETEDAPRRLSPSGIEEFLADGVIILYNIRKEGVRERAIEIFKMRGSKFQEKIVAYQITDTGVVVYPQQQVFGALTM